MKIVLLCTCVFFSENSISEAAACSVFLWSLRPFFLLGSNCSGCEVIFGILFDSGLHFQMAIS